MNNAFGAMYAASPVWLQHLLLSAYGLRLRFLRYGRLQRAYLGELRRTQWLSEDKLRALQLQRLNTLVRHAYDTVPLYRNRSKPDHRFTELEQLQELPVLTKDELRAPRSIVTSALWGSRRLQEVHTGGTTGKPLAVDHLL